MKATITKEDFDAAIASGEWSSVTCVMAQFLNRTQGVQIQGCTGGGGFINGKEFKVEPDQIDLVDKFDYLFPHGKLKANEAQIQRVRDLLPIEVEVTVRDR